jgi:hypothetical protein
MEIFVWKISNNNEHILYHRWAENRIKHHSSTWLVGSHRTALVGAGSSRHKVHRSQSSPPINPKLIQWGAQPATGAHQPCRVGRPRSGREFKAQVAVGPARWRST